MFRIAFCLMSIALVAPVPQAHASGLADVIGLGLANVGKKKSSKSAEKGGISSETHRENVGKLVFAHREIVKGDEDDSTFRDAFELSDGIYGRIYLDHAACPAGESWCALNFEFLADDEVFYQYASNISGKNAGWWTWQVVMSPSPGDDHPYGDQSRALPVLVLDRPADTQRVEVRVTSAKGELLAGGGYSLTSTVASRDAYLARRFERREAFFRDADLERQTGEAYAQSHARHGGGDVLGVAIRSNDWQYTRNQFNEPKDRKLSADVYTRDGVGHCWRHDNQDFFQNHEGGGQYGRTHQRPSPAMGRTPARVPCSFVPVDG